MNGGQGDGLGPPEGSCGVVGAHVPIAVKLSPGGQVGCGGGNVGGGSGFGSGVAGGWQSPASVLTKPSAHGSGTHSPSGERINPVAHGDGRGMGSGGLG